MEKKNEGRNYVRKITSEKTILELNEIQIVIGSKYEVLPNVEKYDIFERVFIDGELYLKYFVSGSSRNETILNFYKKLATENEK